MFELNWQRAGLLLAAVSFGALAAGQARAQGTGTSAAPASQDTGTASEDSNEEIIVIAQKRKENIQNVPIAITAVTGQRLQNIGITSTQDLAQVVPGLIVESSLGGIKARLRGVGTAASGVGAENSIATYVDGVYILSLGGALVQLNNIEQVEVLKGPQGTLFGRNATGGVISIRTRDPRHEPGGDFTLRYGNYDTIAGQAYLTAGIAETLAADIAGYFSVQGDGWGKNLSNGKDVNRMDEYAVRSKWLYEPGERDQFRLTGDYSETKGTRFNSFRPIEGTSNNYGPGNTIAAMRPDLAPFVLSGALAPFAEVGDPYVFTGGDFYDINVLTQPRYLFRTGGVSLQWDHEFDGLRLTSITAYRRAYTNLANQFSPVPALRSLGTIRQKDRQFSQELQIGSLEGAPIQWVAGLYYLNGRGFTPEVQVKGTTIAPLESLTFRTILTTKSGAAFGQVTAPLWPGGHLTGGLRYTIERRGIEGDTSVAFLPPLEFLNNTSPPVHAHKVFKKLTWRIALDQKLTPDILGYVSYNRGFKSGLFNGIPANPEPIEPEVLDAFEAGLKTELLNRRIRLNVAGFYYDYKNIQVTLFTQTSSIQDNGARARAYGADIDLTARIGPHLSIFGGATLMHSEFRSYPLAAFLVPQPVAAGGGVSAMLGSAKGKKLPFSPDVTFNIGGSYTAPVAEGEINLNVNYSYSSKWYPGPDNIVAQPSYGLLDGSATYTLPGGRVSLGVWARNITDEQYYVSLGAQSNPGGGVQGVVGAPRTYGVKAGYRF